MFFGDCRINVRLTSFVLVAIHTMGPTYSEFVYNEHPAITSRFLCISIIRVATFESVQNSLTFP